MDSFYGGQPGTSIIIKECFETIEEMEENFNLGIKYTDVRYGEYCTVEEDSSLYRRGFTEPELICKMNMVVNKDVVYPKDEYKELPLPNSTGDYDNFAGSTSSLYMKSFSEYW